MFKNFKVIAHMATPIAITDFITLDSIISAAKAKELLKDDYYAGANVCGTKEQIDEYLGKLLDKKYRVYCTSAGVGDNKEFITSWSKRWDDKNDDMVNGFRGKVRVDTGAGYFKNYHMPLVVKAYKTISFYVRGNLEEVKRLLEEHIYYLGKKGSQGYGQVQKWEFEEIEEDYSLFKDGKPMRYIPVTECLNYIKRNSNNDIKMQEKAIIPPYWREDNREICIMPEVI